MPQNVLAFGGSRHIGYHASLRFLDAGSHVTFLLRNPDLFAEDESIQKHVQAGTAHIIKGDALNIDNVREAWAEATKSGPVTLVLFTLGFSGSPSFKITKGFVISPVNLVSQCLLNVLTTYPTTTPKPKLIMISTIGVSISSRKTLPLLLRFVYGYLIQVPLADKLTCERMINHFAGWEWNSLDGEPSQEVITGEGVNLSDWKERQGVPPIGGLDAMIIRAAGLNDDVCRADSVKEGEAPYRVAAGEITGKAPWGISRKDVGHFIFETVEKNWGQWGGKQISISY